jgi:hypothetical protein
MPGKSETASYVLRSADIPVCRIAGFQACNRFGFPHEAGNWSEPADRNVGDTADRNVCATNARDAEHVHGFTGFPLTSGGARLGETAEAVRTKFNCPHPAEAGC